MDGGHFVYANGISDPSDAVLIDNRNGEGKITKEMYIKGNRYLGGFWVVNFDDDETAQKWAKDASLACQQSLLVLLDQLLELQEPVNKRLRPRRAAG